ncbi:MAG: right-handed parallel beta-helix repeat-containing protein [Thiomicrorhabdus sp.]|nr:right-handed parallel beta-helix repeat-containing protein [Thiomicrorhabdus sp.]
MKRLLLVFRTFFIAGLIAGSTTAYAAEPVIFFSDLISAPKSGWDSSEPDKGAIVTIWGRNFGTQRGSSYVTVNGIKLTAESDYKDVWAKTNNPVPFLQTITFQLNSSMSNGDGTISVNVNNKTSNTIPFRVNTIGSIYFIDVNASGGTGTLSDPWSNLRDFIDEMQPGDVGYFREGTFDKIYNGGKSNIWVRKSETSGTAQDPIGFIGYPNEVAMFDSWTNGHKSNFNKSILVASYNMTVAKLATKAFARGIEIGRYGRIIGNDTIGVQELIGGDGIIVTGSDGVKILGNTVHGGRSGDRLDHSIYVGGCQELAGNEIAYNYSYDNLIDRGPHFVDNHQQNRCASDVFMLSNHWHNNVISCEADASRGIGIYDLSWDKGDANEPDPAYVYNNILVGCGDGWNGAMYHANGHAVFYNNILFNNQGRGIQLYDNSRVLSSKAINNIIVNATTDEYVVGDRHTFDSNSYFGGPADSIPSSDTNAVVADPMITVDSTAYNPVIIDKDSPIIGKGSSAVSYLVTRDFFGTKQAGSYNIGSVGNIDSEGGIVIPPMITKPTSLKVKVFKVLE